MQRAFLGVNGVKTKVLTYGRWVEESPKTEDPEDIILMIPGNPGVTEFYKLFLLTLHEKTGYPCWIVGHAGHELPQNTEIFQVQPLEGNENLFGLEGQIRHKEDFIEKYVPQNARLHLVGHSIGSYVILELLKNESINSRVVDVNLLFPAIEYMAETPQGTLFKYLKPVLWISVFLAWIFTVLPTFLQNILVYLYMTITGLPHIHFKTIIDFIHPAILENVYFLAYEELDQVRERDSQLIRNNSKKIRFFYGHKDGWVPLSYCDKLKNDIPEANIEIGKFSHAFVLNESREVGCMVADWLAA